MKHTKTRLFALAFALIMALAFAACSNGNSGSGFSGVGHSNRPTSDPTNTPADTSNTPDPTGGEPTNSGQEQTPTPDTSTEPPPTLTVAISDILQLGGYDWRVLDIQGRKILIISEKIFPDRKFDASSSEVKKWENSDIREYLNSSFYNDMFTAGEKAQIIETKVINKDYGENDTMDKIFLLSVEEVVKYFGDSGKLADEQHNRTIDDEYNDARIAYTEDGDANWWWLRTSAHYSDYIAYVSRIGRIHHYLQDGNDQYSAGGVRPALWLNLQ